MIRRVVAFDLDNTLADSKSPITAEMAGLLDRLLARFQVCVISGGKFEQFEAQRSTLLAVVPDRLGVLHVMPTCGTRYYRFDVAAGCWQQVYAEDLAADKRTLIIAALNEGSGRAASSTPARCMRTWRCRPTLRTVQRRVVCAC